MRKKALFFIVMVATVLLVAAHSESGYGPVIVGGPGPVCQPKCRSAIPKHRVKHRVYRRKPSVQKKPVVAIRRELREVRYRFDASEVASLKKALYDETGKAVKEAVPRELARYMPALKQVVKSELEKDALIRQAEYEDLPRMSIWHQLILPLAIMLLAIALVVISLLTMRRQRT